MSFAAISVEGLSKVYHIGLKQDRADTLTGAVQNLIRKPLTHLRHMRRMNTFKHQEDAEDTFWALKDVSFEVAEGEVVGIIGRNGAGKSTLLKILSRITEPTSGRAVIRGRVSSLLEVGTGFHQELSGRDNVYMNGTILGMSKREIDRKFDEIVAFSGVEKFLDTPIKHYSSGMKVRLAFAVAAHLEPEILIIDEVLAVGDAEFQKKCLGKMHEVAIGGRTVLFVSHNMAAVESLCRSGVELQAGEIASQGLIDDVIDHYRDSVHGASDAVNTGRFDDCELFECASIVNQFGDQVKYVEVGQSMHIRIQFRRTSVIDNPVIGIGVDNDLGQRMFTVHTPVASKDLGRIQAESIIHCNVESLPLAPGQYTIKLAASHNGQVLEEIDPALRFTVEDGDAFGEGRGHHRGVCSVRAGWWKEVSSSEVSKISK